MNGAMALFRSEVMKHRTDRLHGNAQTTLPVSWQIVGGLLFLIVVAAIAFLSFADYSRIETVTGEIAPEGGIARIVPSRAGIVFELPVTTGTSVAAGATLALVRSGESLAGGGTSSTEILGALNLQEKDLRNQQRYLTTAAVAERSQLEARVLGIEADIDGLRSQIDVQEGLVQTSRKEFELAQSIADRGFISRRDILQREETYLNRQQQLSQLRQDLATQRAAITEARAAMRQTTATTEGQIAALAGQRSDLMQKRTNAEASDAYSLKAPIAGIVTALTARKGQAVSPQAPIMSIVPNGSELRAELYVPTSAIGFLDVGQEVSIALDAFPYQRFGTISARIATIASAPILLPDATGNPIASYIVTASLESDRIEAFSNFERLLPGMTLTARITTEKQSLIRWLFEPLFAVRRR